MTEQYIYDEATLSIVCPVCSAAVTAKCLYRKPAGGWGWMDVPHAERYITAHPLTGSDYTIFGETATPSTVADADLWGEPLTDEGK